MNSLFYWFAKREKQIDMTISTEWVYGITTITMQACVMVPFADCVKFRYVVTFQECEIQKPDLWRPKIAHVLRYMRKTKRELS